MEEERESIMQEQIAYCLFHFSAHLSLPSPPPPFPSRSLSLCIMQEQVAYCLLVGAPVSLVLKYALTLGSWSALWRHYGVRCES